MPKGIKRCRVCGKEYEACHSLLPNNDKFRWQDVACSIECGSKYFTDILLSRNESLDSLPDYLRVDADPVDNNHDSDSVEIANDAEDTHIVSVKQGKKHRK